jgi:hypothetical protein
MRIDPQMAFNSINPAIYLINTIMAFTKAGDLEEKVKGISRERKD